MLQDGLIVVSDVDIVRLIHPHSLLRLPMQNYQPAKLLRLHFTERDRHHGKPLYEAIVSKCLELKIAGASVFEA